MKLFIVSVLVAVASAKPSGIISPLVYSAPVAVAAPVAISSPVSTQYHSQDELGQYSYGYSNAHSAKTEARSANGITVGGYTYVDPQGQLQTVEYSSDVNGFRVAATNLPVPPALPAAPALPVPVPVQDTPEVVEARARHLEAFEAVKVRATEVIAPAVSTVVQPLSPAPLLAAPVLPNAPIALAKSAVAVPAETPQSSPVPSTEAPTTPAPVEATSVSAPAVEATSVSATPAGVSVLSTPNISVRSFVAPALPVGVAPVVSAPLTYSVNSLHPYGFTSVVAQPALTAYTTQFLAPAPGNLQTGETLTPAKEGEQRSE